MKVRFRRFSSRARCPQKATAGSAAYDLLGGKSVVLESGSTRSVETYSGFCFSKKHVAKIYLRLSFSLRSILLGCGIIDSDYRGNVRIISHNFSQNRIEFNVRDRIGQVLFKKKESPRLVEVENFNDFVTERDTKGFGSTGILKELWLHKTTISQTIYHAI